jgi:hypothetical protein
MKEATNQHRLLGDQVISAGRRTPNAVVWSAMRFIVLTCHRIIPSAP